MEKRKPGRKKAGSSFVFPNNADPSVADPMDADPSVAMPMDAYPSGESTYMPEV